MQFELLHYTAKMKKPIEIYKRNTGYTAKAFLFGDTAALTKGYAAQALHARVIGTTMALMTTWLTNMHTRAPMSRGKRQYPNRLRL